MRDKDILHFTAKIIIMYHVGIAHSMLEDQIVHIHGSLGVSKGRDTLEGQII